MIRRRKTGLKRINRKPYVKEVKKECNVKDTFRQFTPLQENFSQVNPLQEFFDDMSWIQRTIRDPSLAKPSFDAGGPLITNILLWKILEQLVRSKSKKLDKKSQTRKENKNVIVKESLEQTNPLQEFFDDMDWIQSTTRDPNLIKPAFDVGGPAVTNIILWKVLEQLVRGGSLNA